MRASLHAQATANDDRLGDAQPGVEISPMITPWMIFLEIMPVLAMVLAIVCVPLLSDGPPRHPDHAEQ